MVGNEPEPLRDCPVRIFEAPDWQMSHGERAALEGILTQVRPRLAVEIGTAEGGSIRRIARHSEHVHSFDLCPPAPDVVQTPNVAVHTGDSRLLLPSWLGMLRHHIDFALVDGDHAAEGVRADLSVLLDSRWCERTVILCHDAAHPQTREGIRTAVHGREDAYVDLDFTAGYIFARGPFAGGLWGGFALIVTGQIGAGREQDLYRTH